MAVILTSLQVAITRFPGYTLRENMAHKLKAGLALREERLLRLFWGTASYAEVIWS
jgi:hypothetical protein